MQNSYHSVKARNIKLTLPLCIRVQTVYFVLYSIFIFLVNKQTKNKHDKTKVAALSSETATAASEAATRTRGKMLYDKKKIIKRGEMRSIQK